MFLSQVLRDTAAPGDDPDHALGEMDVQIVRYDLPLDIGSGAVEHALKESREVGFAPVLADPAGNLSGRHVEPGDQGLGAVPDILELPPFDGARTQGQAWRAALQRLDAGHLIKRHDQRARRFQPRGRPRRCRRTRRPGRARVSARRARDGAGGQPPFKKRPTEPWEIVSTSPRFTASRASAL